MESHRNREYGTGLCADLERGCDRTVAQMLSAGQIGFLAVVIACLIKLEVGPDSDQLVVVANLP